MPYYIQILIKNIPSLRGQVSKLYKAIDCIQSDNLILLQVYMDEEKFNRKKQSIPTIIADDLKDAKLKLIEMMKNMSTLSYAVTYQGDIHEIYRNPFVNKALFDYKVLIFQGKIYPSKKMAVENAIEIKNNLISMNDLKIKNLELEVISLNKNNLKLRSGVIKLQEYLELNVDD